ncbi:MAG: phosphotransferase [Candidatus Adiutrix sp.]|nr:phosphotransferase [Candidatus Adiutrix sp.]
MSSPRNESPGLGAWLKGVLGGRPALDPLAGGGGARRYFRLPGQGLLALHGPDRRENLAWLRIGRHLWFKGLPLPRIRAHDLERGFFLLDDLGDDRLDDRPDRLDRLDRAAANLARFHREGLDGFNPAWAFQTKTYNAALVARQEAAYFLRSFAADYLGLKIPRPAWAEARAFARLAVPEPGRPSLMHRDFQGRNLMVNGDEVFILDWQGARLGPAAYDLASLLDDHPFEDLPGERRERLTDIYLKAAGQAGRGRAFRREMSWLGAARLMQALGAFGKLTLAGRPGFTRAMKPVAGRLRRRFSQPPLNRFTGLAAAAEAAAAALGIS